MRTALTLGIQKSGKAVVLAGPEVPVHEQKAELKRLRQTKHEFAEIQLWQSGSGMTHRHRSKETRVAPVVGEKKGEASGPADELAKLSDDKLAEVAVEYEVDLPKGTPRAEIEAAILKAAGYK